MEFQKKPVRVEAFRYNIDPRPDWFQSAVSKNMVITYEDRCMIHTLEGTMCADKGDWIIRGVEGEIYPCKLSIFLKTYAPAKPKKPRLECYVNVLTGGIDTFETRADAEYAALRKPWAEVGVRMVRAKDQKRDDV